MKTAEQIADDARLSLKYYINTRKETILNRLKSINLAREDIKNEIEKSLNTPSDASEYSDYIKSFMDNMLEEKGNSLIDKVKQMMSDRTLKTPSLLPIYAAIGAIFAIQIFLLIAK